MRKRFALLTLVLPLTGVAQILTAQYDSARTGATLTETTLTPANVNAAGFGKVFSLKVDGDVYAQPLYVPRHAGDRPANRHALRSDANQGSRRRAERGPLRAEVARAGDYTSLPARFLLLANGQVYLSWDRPATFARITAG